MGALEGPVSFSWSRPDGDVHNLVCSLRIGLIQCRDSVDEVGIVRMARKTLNEHEQMWGIRVGSQQ